MISEIITIVLLIITFFLIRAFFIMRKKKTTMRIVIGGILIPLLAFWGFITFLIVKQNFFDKREHYNQVHSEYSNFEYSKLDKNWLIGSWSCKYWEKSRPSYPGGAAAPVCLTISMKIINENVLYYDGHKTTYRIVDNELLIKDPEAHNATIAIPIDKENRRLLFGENELGKFYFRKD